MRVSIVVVIAAVVIGGAVASIGFLTNQESVAIPEISDQYANLEKYRDELEKINGKNQVMLESLQEQIKNSDDVHLEQIMQEIDVVKRVIGENKAELEGVIKRLAEMKPEQ